MSEQPGRDEIFAATTAERRRVADLIDGLDETEARTPSLCAGWEVKTVVAHLISTLVDGPGTFVRLAVRHRSLDGAIDELARRRSHLSTTALAEGLRQHADRRISPPLVGPLDPLADVLVHAGDIRIPLGLPFQPDPHQVGLALDFLAGGRAFGLVPRRRLKGLRLRGTDIDRTWGTGTEVRGPVAALMLTVAGRRALLDQLEGPGAALLRSRV